MQRSSDDTDLTTIYNGREGTIRLAVETHTKSQWLSGIWSAVHTPFLSDGEVDRAGVRSNGRHYAKAIGLDGVFCNGLMGEGWALGSAERKQIVDDLLHEVGDDLGVGVVATHHSQRETLYLARHAKASGAHHIILMRPNALLTDDDLVRHVSTIFDAVDLPIILFEAGAPHQRFGKAVIKCLAEKGAIAAVKSTQGIEAAAQLRDHCEGKVLIADPLEENWLTNMIRFDLRVLYADPEGFLFQRAEKQPIRDYFDAAQSGDIERAWRIQSELEELRRVYNRWILWPLNRGLPPNAALKLWCEAIGLAAGPVRSPLSQLPSLERDTILSDLAKINSQIFPNLGSTLEVAWKS